MAMVNRFTQLKMKVTDLESKLERAGLYIYIPHTDIIAYAEQEIRKHNVKVTKILLRDMVLIEVVEDQKGIRSVKISKTLSEEIYRRED